MSEYAKQYEMMIRWLDRIEGMAEKGEGEIDTVDLKDYFIAFFQTCYHLKDYIKNDPSAGIADRDVETFVDTTDCMGICADICNASKHLRLSGQGRSGEHPEMREGAHVTVDAGAAESWATYKIETDTGEKDAYKVAKDCRDAWVSFMKSSGLPIP